MVSIWHGVTDLVHPPHERSATFVANYVVLGIALLLEGSSFIQATRQVRGAARRWRLHPLTYVDRTSNPTVRAVFLEDLAALIGIALAAIGIALHQVTGEAAYDAVASIAIGLLLAVVAVFLMRRNMQYLMGEGLSPQMRSDVLRRMLEHPEIDRITYLHVEFVGPQRLFVVAAVDLVGDDNEAHLALRLRRVEADIEKDELIEDSVLTLAPPDEPALTA
jgi:divalent metal cation (Fe/Co/Zn/Cd) transporter